MFADKIAHGKKLIEEAVKKYPKIAVACSFGKDSMVTVHIARSIEPKIPIFSIMTVHKPKETFEYLVKMNDIMNLNVTVYMVAEEIPKVFLNKELEVILLSTNELEKSKKLFSNPMYKSNPDECCRILKVNPTKLAVKDLDAWISGLRNTEGRIREDYKEIENKGGLVKINPILTFTEEEIFRYLNENKIEIHPWYTKKFPDGKKYRSLGCGPCTNPIYPHELERQGRWQGTSKCGGECGIHTLQLKCNNILR